MHAPHNTVVHLDLHILYHSQMAIPFHPPGSHFLLLFMACIMYIIKFYNYHLGKMLHYFENLIILLHRFCFC